MRFFILLAALLVSTPAFSFVCKGEDLEKRVAQEFLKFFECGGQFREGQGKCLDAQYGNFDLIATRIPGPQNQSGFKTFELRDSDKLNLDLDSVREDRAESGEGFRVFSATFELVRGKLTMPFTFRFTMQRPDDQASYGCAVMMGAPKNRGTKYFFSAKPSLN